MESKSQVGILLFLGAVVLLYYVGFPQQLRETAEQPQAWSTHPQGEFYGQVGGLLSSSRRNHGCLMEVNPSSGHMEAIHFAGRFGNNIEAMDMNSAFPATRLLSQPEEELLAINHIAFEYVDKLAPHSATAPHHDNSHRGGLGKEIWIMCGFWGDRTNSEVAIDNIHIIDADTWQVRKGPLLPSARGSCGSFAIAGPSDQLDWSPSNPHRHTSSSTISSSSSSSLTSSSIIQGRMVCTVGGFLGAHNSGESIDDVDCYDRVKEEWVKLPSLPRPIDHGNAVFVPKSTCPDFKDDQVLLLNGRTGAYGSSQMEMYKLDIHAGHQWQELPFTSPTQIGAAAVALTPDGHLIVVGGIDYPPIHRRRSYKSPDIHVLDLCRGLACASRYQLDFPRWALYPCYSPVSEQLMICGGDAGLVSENEATGSVSSCRLFNVTSIVNDCHHQSAWVPSNAAHIHSQNHFPFLHHPSP